MGLLTEEGGRDVGKYVKELRLGARLADFDDRRYTPFPIGTLSLPNCSTVLIEQSLIDAHRPGLFRPIFTQLRPTTLTFPAPGYFSYDPFILPHVVKSTLPNQIGLPYQAWPSLRVLHLDGTLLRAANPHYHSNGFDLTRPNIPILSTWTVLTVVFSSRGSEETSSSSSRAGADLWESLAGGFHPPGEGAFAGWGRVELRVEKSIEDMFREMYEAQERSLSSGSKRMRSKEERKLLLSIVFVGEDGEERRLIEKGQQYG
ncbi:hypothetical protein BDY24DRAFT_383440 [Mrakia frigida]|uniref:uncharacterized protein n=1 Tax=Mrakia frigida TaxID=29902 RepID=UPI003FCC0E06